MEDYTMLTFTASSAIHVNSSGTSDAFAVIYQGRQPFLSLIPLFYPCCRFKNFSKLKNDAKNEIAILSYPSKYNFQFSKR